jgi:hypothetical protein
MEDMLPREVVAVAVRLFAICLGISVLRLLPSLLITDEGRPLGYAYGFFCIGVTAAIALALWFFPHLAAGKLISGQPEKDATASADTWLAMGSALIGLWMLTYAVPALIRDAFVLLSAGSEFADTANIKSWVLYNVVEVSIALWLVLGANGFRQLFWWARSAGLGKPSGE